MRTVSPAHVALCHVGVLLAGILLLGVTQADPDLWGHVRYGHDIVTARALPRVDAYSFTSDREWINHEWLSEASMYGAWRAGGAAGLTALRIAILFALVALVARTVSKRVSDPRAVDGLLLLTILGVAARGVNLRPQLFSLLLFAVLLALIDAADRGNRRALLAVPAVFAVWVNLHGGWVVGGAILAVWVAFRAVSRSASWPLRLQLGATAAAAAAATLVSPYGTGMWRFLWETVGLSRTDIADWQPIFTMTAPIVVIWLLVAGVAIVAAVRLGKRNDPARLSMVLLLGFMSFRVNRLDAFFALATVLMLAPQLGRFGASDPRARHRAAAQQRWVAVAVTALIVLPGSLAARPQLACIRLERQFLPERDSASFVVQNHLAGRMVTWFSYGEYATWHLGPALRVSLDGRRETVYSDAVLKENYAFFRGEPASLDYPIQVHADYVWLPNAVPAAAQLEQRGWSRIFKGSVSSVFARAGDDRRYTRPAPASGCGCFPGP